MADLEVSGTVHSRRQVRAARVRKRASGLIFAAGLRDLVSKNVRPIENRPFICRFYHTRLLHGRSAELGVERAGRPLGKKSGRPCGDGSARFFFYRVGFACRVQSDFLVCEPGKLDDSPLCALSFGRAFSDVKRPRAVARARTSRDTRAHRRRPNERGFGAVVSRSHRPGGSRIRRYRASPTRVDGPPRRRLKAFTPRNPSVSGCPSLFDVPLAPPRPSRRGRRIRRPSPISADGRGGRGRVQAVAGAESRTPRVGLPVRRGDPVGQPAGSSSVSDKKGPCSKVLETMRFLLARVRTRTQPPSRADDRPPRPIPRHRLSGASTSTHSKRRTRRRGRFAWARSFASLC